MRVSEESCKHRGGLCAQIPYLFCDRGYRCLRKMAIEILPLPLPRTADPSKFKDFGREVRGVHPGRLTDEEFKEIEQLLYKVLVVPRYPNRFLTYHPDLQYDVLLFRNVDLLPEEQYKLTKVLEMKITIMTSVSAPS